MNFDFPCKFMKIEDGSQAITSRNLPEVMARLSADETPDEQAKHVIEDCLALRMKRNEAIPGASEPEAGETIVRLSASQEAKILLHNEMVRLGVSRSELARRTGMRLPDVTRLLNLAHPTKLDAVIHVLNVLGVDIHRTAQIGFLRKLSGLETPFYPFPQSAPNEFYTESVIKTVLYRTILCKDNELILFEIVVTISTDKTHLLPPEKGGSRA